MKRLQNALLTALFMLAAAGCGEPAADEMPDVDVEGSESGDVGQEASVDAGKRLFQHETFRGNGRTCTTCHTMATGTLSPADIARRASWDPIFRAIDSDTGSGASYTKLKTHATVTVDINLHPNVTLASNPSARKITLRRGIPSTLDSPALDPVLMWDGREKTLQNQAKGAILGHAQARRTPSNDELNSIALFEKTLFSSDAVKNHAKKGTPLPLPAGYTDSEKRGRAFFEPTGLCGSCHGGPLLNSMTEFNLLGMPKGSRFVSAGVSEFNLAGNPLVEFLVKKPDGTTESVMSPDPGLMLVTGNLADANAFRMTSLRNLRRTAPYFHDNSAKTLTDVMTQYKILFDFLGLPLTQQDMADIEAYMRLL